MQSVLERDVVWVLVCYRCNRERRAAPRRAAALARMYTLERAVSQPAGVFIRDERGQVVQT